MFPERTDLDLAIVGGGAAGLMAGIAAGRSAASGRIAILDGASKIGAKILISGGGRCNVTHDVVRPEDFSASSKNQVAKVLRSFTVEQTIAFFREAGVNLKREETGKLFPLSDRARTVVDALLREVARAGTEVVTGCRVVSVAREGEQFVLETTEGRLSASRLVLATGGRSVPRTGSDGGGYELARQLGHSIAPTFPALVPLLLREGDPLLELKGITVECELSLRGEGGRLLRRERGSLLFTHFGLSGPVVLDMSRHWIAAGRPAAGLSVSFVPGKDLRSLEEVLIAAAASRPRAQVLTLLEELVTARLAGLILISGGVPRERVAGQMTRDERRRIAHLLSGFPLHVCGDRGFDVAEVTAGGVPLAEVNVATMESRICPGLFLCGEILDVDGRIGGYNFQWAWASGKLAGESALKGLVLKDRTG